MQIRIAPELIIMADLCIDIADVDIVIYQLSDSPPERSRSVKTVAPYAHDTSTKSSRKSTLALHTLHTRRISRGNETAIHI
jgi:hypothetical protein